MLQEFLITKYIDLLESLDYLQGFKQLRNDVYNFRCPFCGDSSTNTNKKRGYLLRNPNDGNSFYFYCHNCGTSFSFRKFLQELSPELYEKFRLEAFKNKDGNFFEHNSENALKVPKIELNQKVLIKSVAELPEKHEARLYLSDRKVPEYRFSDVFWADDFPELVKENIGNKYEKTKLPKSGIVFPLKELDGKLTGYQIRSIDKNVSKAYRFVICSINQNHGYFYCKDFDITKKKYVVEGTIDSLFLPNSIAVLNAGLYRFHPDENCVYVNDNEPYNVNVSKMIKKCVDKGYSTVLLPMKFNGYDINDMVTKGNIDVSSLSKVYDEYTFKGLKAKIEFARWVKRNLKRG